MTPPLAGPGDGKATPGPDESDAATIRELAIIQYDDLAALVGIDFSRKPLCLDAYWDGSLVPLGNEEARKVLRTFLVFFKAAGVDLKGAISTIMAGWSAFPVSLIESEARTVYKTAINESLCQLVQKCELSKYCEREYCGWPKSPWAKQDRLQVVVTTEEASVTERIEVAEEDRGRALAFYPHALDKFRYAAHKGVWMTWDRNVWKEIDNSEIANAAAEYLEELYTKKLAAAPKEDAPKWQREIQNARRRSRIEGALFFLRGMRGILTPAREWDANGWELNTASHIINLRTGEHRKQTPKDLVTKLAPTEYKPGVVSERWREHVEMALPNENVRRQVQRDLGRALVGKHLSEKLSIWYGGGANGRSTTIKTLQNVLGGYAKAAAPTLLLQSKHDRHPVEMADLEGARIVTTIEVDENRRLAEAITKQLTGGDTIRARGMRENFRDITSTWSIFLVVNHKPIISGRDTAMWRRVSLVPWTATIPEDKQKEQDLVVEELLEEGSGILNWLLEGLEDTKKEPKWTADEVKTATAAYRKEQDVIADWLAARCEFGASYKEAMKDLYADYKAYCEQEGDKPISKKQLSKLLAERGYESQEVGRDKIVTKFGIRLRRAEGRGLEDEDLGATY